MAYAAYRDHRVQACVFPSTDIRVLEVIVHSVDAFAFRRRLAMCTDAGVLRCEPVLQAAPTSERIGSRVRLSIRLDASGYRDVLHCLLASAPDGEIGHLCSWREHLARHRRALQRPSL